MKKSWGTLLPDNLSLLQILKASEDYNEILLSIMELIADRYEADSDYDWVNMKFSPITGENFTEDDMIRGQRVVYGWLQGRALEALVGHSRWFENDSKNERS